MISSLNQSSTPVGQLPWSPLTWIDMVAGRLQGTIHQVAKPDTFPLPRIEDIFTSLEGGKLFSKLDLAHAYLQVPPEESLTILMTIIHPRACFIITASCLWYPQPHRLFKGPWRTCYKGFLILASILN